jgi:hypothetical protein
MHLLRRCRSISLAKGFSRSLLGDGPCVWHTFALDGDVSK